MSVYVLTVIGMGIVTYLTRLAPLWLASRRPLPAWAYQAMRYVPIAVLVAIIAPELVMPGGGQLALNPGNFRLLAGCVAIVVAWRTRNVFITVAAGMVTLWGLTWIFG